MMDESLEFLLTFLYRNITQSFNKIWYYTFFFTHFLLSTILSMFPPMEVKFWDRVQRGITHYRICKFYAASCCLEEL